MRRFGVSKMNFLAYVVVGSLFTSAHWFVGDWVLALVFYLLHGVLSSFAIILTRKRELVTLL